MEGRGSTILNERFRLILRAALGEEPVRADAFRTWIDHGGLNGQPEATGLNEVGGVVFRLSPFLLQAAERYGVGGQTSATLRGVAKYIWLSNVLRLRLLEEALSALRQGGFETIVMKGAALFARRESLAALRVTGDYDIQIRPRNVRGAIKCLIEAGFRSLGPLGEPITEDYLKSIHAGHFSKGICDRTIDLHWRPVPHLSDPRYVDELFARAECAKLMTKSVSIPSLADHLFLTVARPELWDPSEVCYRAAEATHILRDCAGDLDWNRFEELVVRYRFGWIAGNILDLVRKDLAAPVPTEVVERISRRSHSFGIIQQGLKRAPSRRNAIQRSALAIVQIARSEADVASNVLHGAIALFWRQSLRRELIRVIRQEFIPWYGWWPELKRLWGAQAKLSSEFNDEHLRYLQGFSWAEEGGRWSDGKLAVLEMPVAARLGAIVRVRINARSFLPPTAKKFRLAMFAGTGRPRHYVCSTGVTVATDLDIEARVVGVKRRKVVIALALIDASSPREHDHSADCRMLGLFVHGVDVVQC